ncbi:MAG: hypothetical protein FJ027_13105 [Candidatus Rokubacteria bacterium]|nr:hypothetical protein [Candidatus Rokubacteria bacterium]
MVKELAPLLPTDLGPNRVGGSIVLEFKPAAVTGGVLVGLMQIHRPRQRARVAPSQPAAPMTPFWSATGAAPDVNLNGWAIDNENANSPLFRMKQPESPHARVRNNIANGVSWDAKAAYFGRSTGTPAGFWDKPMRTMTSNIAMVMQEFDVVALALEDGPHPLVIWAGRVLGVLSWGWAARRRIVVPPPAATAPAAAAASAPVEVLDVIMLPVVLRQSVSDDFLALCALWNSSKSRLAKIPHVERMSASASAPDAPSGHPFATRTPDAS